ncbi:MAG: hypothetical protein VB080_07730 [Propionicimonas sp.]|uniref:hypothetical protein n=1 Tax=Propionicimonas sp. TaxID=1955623 RepID=UPI002B1FF859|nr:hypothetical protein [Propionicimonas sp.]MEA4944313.1 hypothetical protein [Propionicimonas sp.]MEA5116812.1 hypothetical protein [Propionicimonas sp.]
MNLATIMMLVILALALAIIAVVAVGMQGDLRRSSRVADAMGRTAEHLSGDAAPPQGLVDFMGELPRPGRSQPSDQATARPSSSQD